MFVTSSFIPHRYSERQRATKHITQTDKCVNLIMSKKELSFMIHSLNGPTNLSVSFICISNMFLLRENSVSSSIFDYGHLF